MTVGNLVLLIAAAMQPIAVGSDGPAQTVAAAKAAAVFADMTVATDPDGTTRWVAWGDGEGQTQAAHLALWSRAGLSKQIDWPNGYQPSLKVLPEWRHGQRSVAAVTVQFGAAAVDVSLFDIDSEGRLHRLDNRTVAAVGWRIAPSGEPLLITYTATGARLMPTCLRWAAGAAKLVKRPCPRD